MAAKLTPWFPANVKPMRPGVYKVDTGIQILCWSHFDGEHWNGTWGRVETAAHESGWYGRMGNQGNSEFLKRWRGLATNPTAQGASSVSVAKK